jgi:DNA-binding beta-propeller fold protein YncE
VRLQVLESASFSQPGSFSAPTGIAIDQATGNVYVADSEAGVVDVFDSEGGAPTGGVPSQITGLEFRPAEPEGVAVDNSCYYHKPRLGGAACETYDPSNGAVYVVQSSGGTVAKFKLNGSHVYELAGHLAAGSEPNGVAVDTVGEVYVTNQREEAITEFSSSGTEVGKIEQHTVGTPAYVAVGAPGVAYVGNYGGRVVKLELNSNAVEHEELLSEEGRAVAVGPTGTVFVDEESQVAEYSSSGKLEGQFGSGLLHESVGVAVNDESGYVYVTARGESRNVEAFGTPVVVPEAVTGSASIEKADGIIHVTLSGTVDAEDTNVTSCQFEYGLSTNEVSYEHVASCLQILPFTGHALTSVTTELAGLEGDASYRYRLVTKNENGPGDGHEQRFNTAVSPSVNDQPPSISGTTRTTALVTATLNTENSNSGYDIEYVEANQYNSGAANPYAAGASTTPTSIGAAIGDEPVIIGITGLRPGTTYDYRLSATNQAGTEYGPNYTFITVPPTPPGVNTGAASGVTQTTATVSGSVNSEGLPTTYRFELGPGTEYGTVIARTAGSDAGQQTVTATLQYLAPGTTYHYRLVASNPDGTAYGADRTFTTPSFPYPLTQPAAAVFPNLTGFAPTLPPANLAKKGSTHLTRAQKLSKALKACKKDKSKAKRVRCEKEARKKYGKPRKQ